MTQRDYNFTAGPSYLPEEVLKQIQIDIINHKDSGIGVMEISHRGAAYGEISDEVLQLTKTLLNIGDTHEVLLTTGGATTQGAMIPMNLLQQGEYANHVIGDVWSEQVYEEAKKFGNSHLAGGSTTATSLPKEFDIKYPASYFHYASNNTAAGTQYRETPQIEESVPLICDACSDIFSRPLEINKYGLIYAAAQKNIGIAGVTLVIIRKDLLERCHENIPTMFNYQSYIKSKSILNTPPTFPVYVMREMLRWIQKMGGLEKIATRNRKKASLLYNLLDESEFYSASVNKDDRSLMNVTFTLPDERLTAAFITQAEKEGLHGIKGHSTRGGIRVSMYNACPIEAVEKLVDFMGEFEKSPNHLR